MTGRNVGASVRARLLARARETRQDFRLVLTRYAIERLLYRIGVSRHADHFLLKGALLFDLWFDVPGSAPLGLTDTCAQGAQKGAQWQAFLKRNRLDGLALTDVIAELARFLLPVVEAAASNSPLHGQWKSGGPWSRGEGV